MKTASSVRHVWVVILGMIGLVFLAGVPAGAADDESGPRVDSVLVEAKRLAAKGEVGEAIAKVESHLASVSGAADRASAHEMLGDLHQASRTRSGVTNAIRHYEEALVVAPQIASVHLKQARLQFMLPEFQEQARATLSRYFKLGKTNAEALYLLGAMHKFAAENATNAQQGRLDTLAALKAFQGALRMDDRHVPALGNMADIQFNLGMYPESAAAYEKLVQLPMAPEVRLVALTRLAHAQTKLDNFERATALLDEAASGFAKIPAPNDPVANANLQLERARVLAFKMENRLAAGDPSGALVHGQELQIRIAEIRQEFTSPDLERWDQAVQALVESRGR